MQPLEAVGLAALLQLLLVGGTAVLAPKLRRFS